MDNEHNRSDSLSTAPAARPTRDNAPDEVWSQAATLRDVLRDEETRTQRRRVEAEAARRAAEEQVLDATREVCEQIRARAAQELRAAEEARAEAERVLTTAAAQAQQMMAEADEKLTRAKGAQEQVEGAIIEAQREANDIRDRMRRQASDEIRDMLQDIETLRSSAQRELETQRIVTETARIRAVSPVDVNLPEVGPLNLVAAKQMPIRQRAAASEDDSDGPPRDSAGAPEAGFKGGSDVSDADETAGKRRARGKSAA
ncbi:MAG: hypothetical protein HQ548_02465 [Chloroflexi bacterium]|nr:hypothetical protein [Chloroflexota bacterium]